MELRYQDMRDSHPVRAVCFDLDSGLNNLSRFIPIDSLVGVQKIIIGLPSIERCNTILDMLRAIRARTGRRRAPDHLFKDELDSRCWEVIEQGKVNVPAIVGVVADKGVGPFAGSFVHDFCTNVFMEAHLGVPNLKALTSSDLPAVWVSTFLGELIFGTDQNVAEPRDGYARVSAMPQANGSWHSAIVYAKNDSDSAAIRANHYLSYTPAIARAVLMRNGKGDFWIYVSRDWEVPDGGNVMRVDEADADGLIELGLHVYPMIHDDPRDGYVKWDKSDVWVTDPMPPIPEEGFDELKALLTVMDASRMITDPESWVTRVGAPLSYLGYVNKGDHHYRRGEYALSVDAFSRVLEMHPTDQQAFYGRGGAFKMLEEFDLAVRDFSNAIRSNPEHFESYLKRAEAYASLGDLQRGIDDCSKAIRVAPENTIGYSTRWQIRWNMLQRDMMSLRKPRAGNVRALARAIDAQAEQIIEDIDNAVRLGRNYEDLIIDNQSVAGLPAIHSVVTTAVAILEPLTGGASGPRTATDYYYCGVRALYTNNRRPARQYFEKAKNLGFENHAKLDQHLANLQSTVTRRPPAGNG